MRIKVSQSILGPVYSFKFTEDTTTRILFSASPLLVFGESLTKIDSPQRFGKWDTPRAKRQYCQNFAEGREVAL